MSATKTRRPQKPKTFEEKIAKSRSNLQRLLKKKRQSNEYIESAITEIYI